MSKRLSAERKKELLDVYEKITPEEHLRAWMKDRIALGQTIGYIELTYNRSVKDMYALNHDLFIKYVKEVFPEANVMKTTYEHTLAERTVKQAVIRVDWSNV